MSRGVLKLGYNEFSMKTSYLFGQDTVLINKWHCDQLQLRAVKREWTEMCVCLLLTHD